MPQAPRDPAERMGMLHRQYQRVLYSENVILALNDNPPYPLRGSQLGWAIGQFYRRNNWGFSDAAERRTFFHQLMLQFDQKWPVRDELYPNVPIPLALDNHQQHAVARRKDALRRNLQFFWLWINYGRRFFGVEWEPEHDLE